MKEIALTFPSKLSFRGRLNKEVSEDEWGFGDFTCEVIFVFKHSFVLTPEMGEDTICLLCKLRGDVALFFSYIKKIKNWTFE